ncbi:uncharacterized protein LOC117610092 [Osmia lignaria lignaria]|uniref:uncharacterized protein LOC117610092 n=1 Tax=Osmia lignaria lignaria TaxID=1437193 RepID=UPI00402B81D0
MILKTILLGSLLFQSSVTENNDSNHQQRFHKAIEYWTEILCTLQKTKTIVFHGIFTNGTKTLQDFFQVLLRTTNEYCNSVILLKIYSSSSVYQEQTTSIIKYNSLHNLLHNKWNVKRNWRKNDEHFIDIWSMNVIFFGDNDAFEELLLNTSIVLNSREHFIVLAVWNDALEMLLDRRQMIDRILRKIWSEHRVLNVIFNEPLSNRGFNSYAYNPFLMNKEKSWGQLERVEVTSQRHLLHLLSTLHQRRTINFQGHKFNVSMFHQDQEGTKIRGKIDPNSVYVYSGGYNWTSGILLGVLARKINFTVNVIEPADNESYGYQMENGKFNGAIGDLMERKVVASFAFFFVKRYGNDISGMEFTATVGFDEVCVITPKAAKIPKGLRMYQIFQPSVWFCIILSSILAYLAWYYIQVFASRRLKKIDGQGIALHTLFVISGYPIPLPNATSERCLLVGVLISSTTIVGVFNGMLYTMFTNDVYYKEINNLKQLDKSGLPIGYSASTKDLFGTKNDLNLNPIFKRLQKKMIYIPNNIEMTATYRNVSGLLRKQHYLLIGHTLRNKYGEKLVHRMKKCPAKFYLACLLPSNSFLRERINILINRLNQAGLPPLWREVSVLEHALKMKLNLGKHHNHKNNNFEALRLKDLNVCFVIFAIGQLSSIIVFFYEKKWLKLSLKKIS